MRRKRVRRQRMDSMATTMKRRRGRKGESRLTLAHIERELSKWRKVVEEKAQVNLHWTAREHRGR